MPDFIPGLELNRRFYWEVVRPLLDRFYPSLAHAAALVGNGSEVLGFDTRMSMDHDWSPRLLIFLHEQEIESMRVPLQEMLSHQLPFQFLGFPVHRVESPEEVGTFVMQEVKSGPVNHLVTPVTLREFILRLSGWDPVLPLRPVDWLSFPSQVLRSLVTGEVYYDGLGELGALRQTLAWYPHDVWLYLLACGWQRIGQVEPLMGRAGSVGDELGSALIAARLVRDVMSLSFLFEKQYAPYPKWFGTAFRQLQCSAEMFPRLTQVMQAETWQSRQAALSPVMEALAAAQNRLGLSDPLPEKVTPFFDRPFQVIWGDRFASALIKSITTPEVQQISQRGLIGGVDQFSDSTDLLSNPGWRQRILELYKG